MLGALGKESYRVVLDELRSHPIQPAPFMAEALLQRLLEKALYNTRRVQYVNEGKLNPAEVRGLFINFLKKEALTLYEVPGTHLHPSFKAWLISPEGFLDTFMWVEPCKIRKSIKSQSRPLYTTIDSRKGAFQWEDLEHACVQARLNTPKYQPTHTEQIVENKENVVA